MNTITSQQKRSFSEKLRSIDIGSLHVNDYHRGYILRMLPVIDYYVDIYSEALTWVCSQSRRPLGELTIVDYGGGEGFFSLFAKHIGVHSVIYVDMNPEATDTADKLSKAFGIGPDEMVTGDSLVLKQWCHAHRVCPDAIVGMDVIEHIYCLDEFFNDLIDISHQMPMVFTTASTPYNRRIVRKLHKVMKADELGDKTHEGFVNVRRSFIHTHYPDMDEAKLNYWAANTRGLIYDDILRAIDCESPNLLRDKYNTCDPSTGSWTERILPTDDYRQLLMPYGYTLAERNGFYNNHRGGIKGILSSFYNRRLQHNKNRHLAPFLFLFASPKVTSDN